MWRSWFGYLPRFVGPRFRSTLGSSLNRCHPNLGEVLLTIVEGIPSRRPKLHTLQYPKKGSHGNDGWSGWFLERCRSPEDLERVKACRALEKAYLDGLREK